MHGMAFFMLSSFFQNFRLIFRQTDDITFVIRTYAALTVIRMRWVRVVNVFHILERFFTINNQDMANLPSFPICHLRWSFSIKHAMISQIHCHLLTLAIFRMTFTVEPLNVFVVNIHWFYIFFFLDFVLFQKRSGNKDNKGLRVTPRPGKQESPSSLHRIYTRWRPIIQFSSDSSDNALFGIRWVDSYWDPNIFWM